MKQNKRFLISLLPAITFMCALVMVPEFADAARATTASRGTATAAVRKTVAATATKTETTKVEESETVTEPEPDEEFVITNKSSQFEATVSSIIESSSDDNSFAQQIRLQRAALAASEASSAINAAQRNALKNGSNVCDRDLRKCMMEKCGNDFTKCALDGDTVFGDKLNACKTKTTCGAHEFTLFVQEIKADRDMNARLASYENVINCGNQYNACILNECGTTYDKCLGKQNADMAIKKCETIAKECTEADSGLTARFGDVIGKLRGTAEEKVKTDEERLYKLRDLMRSACETLGAAFDERSFDCVYTVNFFAGENQEFPMASRKRYAGDTFVCMQEWFGVNATTYKENAYRETRAQTAASSAMLGSGVGTAVGAITSGAINRAIDTKKAKKALDEEKKSQGLPTEKEERQQAREDRKEARQQAREDRKEERQQKREDRKAEQAFKKQEKGDSKEDACNQKTGYEWNPIEGKCEKSKKNTTPTTRIVDDGNGDEGDIQIDRKNIVTDENRMSDDDVTKEIKFLEAQENDSTIGTNNADDYDTVRSVLDKFAPK